MLPLRGDVFYFLRVVLFLFSTLNTKKPDAAVKSASGVSRQVRANVRFVKPGRKAARHLAN
jgi:hypothetical protein